MSNQPSVATAPEFHWNPWDEDFRANPYPHLKALASSPPRALDLGRPLALIARYDDAVAVLRDHSRFSSVPLKLPFNADRMERFGNAPTMVFSDPPVHTRLRRLVSPVFTPRRIRDLEPRLRAITEHLLDKAEAKGELEVMADLANPLPMMVIAAILGIPPEEHERFKRWSDTLMAVDMIPLGMPVGPEVREATAAIRAYFAEQIERRRDKRGDDLISVLVAAHQGEHLSVEELNGFLILLLLAGNETTTNLIGNGLMSLGKYPEQLGRLRREPALMPAAIEEMLRYESPVQAAARVALENTEVGGVPIKAGTTTVVLLGAANRDPAQFPDPDRFDVARRPNDHVAFGEGIHFCIGAPLARMEASIAIGMALDRFPRLRLAEPDAPFTFKGSYFMRGLASLRMAIE
jgi:cytochrome P450